MSFDDLPLEITQDIFSLLCCRGVEFRIPQEPDRTRSGTTQVTLSLVCSSWREIALNTRTLWGDVMVYYDAGRERAQRSTTPFRFVQNWLNRARTTPISLYIYVSDAWEFQIAAISQTLLSSFHITNLRLVSHKCYHSLLPTNNSYHLESLHLSLYAPARDTFPRLPEMPSLKGFHLCVYPDDFVDLPNIYYSIPWHQLRVFTLSEAYWSSQMLFNILQRCESLVQCTLLVKLEYGQHEHDIVLPNLESLVLDMDGKSSTYPIIRSLTLPNLRSLDIRGWMWETTFELSTEAIVMMAQRSGFKRLTDFSLCRTEQPVDVRSLLGSMPALKSVQLHGPLMFQPGTFDDLSSGTIVPQLEEIRFGVMSDEEIGLLLETVGQRHEKAKTVSDIRRFAHVTGRCTSESELKSHNQRAKQCGEAFNAHVAILDDSPSEY
ncbi:hypothetical protein M378DRAFT_1012040 [Amanita muscaria Koide BX008]|uniref:Uncharacterized protein n=1 Tax=Amanita muscaria (strain Koide BX008) TaxID=946122 RepID=A0A0C2SYY2_AMAMK|nr:hypothetical protein M378DRAFT_1012040 [Amanita muscaria Koide BX008]